MKNIKITKTCSRMLSIFILFIIFFSNSLSAFAYNYDGTEYTQVPGTLIYYDQYVTTEELNEVILQYNNLPYAIKQSWAERGIKIYVRSIELPRNSNGSNVGAYAFLPYVRYYTETGQICEVDYSDCRIEYYSKNHSTADEGVLYHEAGHLLDSLALICSNVYCGSALGISGTEAWNYYYVTYYNVLNNYDRTSPYNVSRGANEGLAEAVRILYANPQWLISQCPDMYNYLIQNISTTVNGDCTPLSVVTASQTVDTFDYIGYANTYPDLYAVFGYDRQSLYNHYVNCGRAEGRIANFNGSSSTPVSTQAQSIPQTLEHFDYTAYANAYPDLYAAFGYNAAALYNHYITYGITEGRIGSFR